MNPIPREQPALRARYRRILWFAARVLAESWWFEILFPKIGLTGITIRTRERRMLRIARKFHVLAVDLGGLMIKVGQFMSSRLDVLPPAVTQELAGLQDEVPAVPFADIRTLAERELGARFTDIYEWIDEQPIAAASLGQAHRARLSAASAADAGFADVVVKVQRPGIDQVVETDLAALQTVGGWLRRIRLVSRRVDAPALVQEFSRTSREEIDYLHEASSVERFAANFADDDRVGTPAVAWERSTRRVLTLEDVTAIKISDADALRAAGIDPADVAQAFSDVMFDQFFSHSYFHADPHPGNVFVTPLVGEERGWRLTFIDFGMMGEVPQAIRDSLRGLVIAAAARDGKQLVAAAERMGVLLPSAQNAELEQALTKLFARFGGMAVAELRDVNPRELQAFAEEFAEVVRTLPLQLPEGLLMLFRAISLTSGMCSGLNPSFNVWDAVEPYSTRLLREEAGNAAQDIAKQALANARALWRLPERVDAVLGQLEDGGLRSDGSVGVRLDLERRVSRLELLVRQLGGLVIGFGALGAGLAVVDDSPVWGAVLFGVAGAAVVFSLAVGLFTRGRK